MATHTHRKAYKFSDADVELLDSLRARLSTDDLQASEVDTLRAAFRALKAKLDARDSSRKKIEKSRD